jgi:hypothetical protein
MLNEPDILCRAELAVTGNLQPPGAPPLAEEGCVPFGTWTVNVEMVDQGECQEVPFYNQYVYEVTPEPNEGGYLVVYTAEPMSENVQMKITEGGPGDCEGSFEHHSGDGKAILVLKPHERDLAITGHAYYEVFQ